MSELAISNYESLYKRRLEGEILENEDNWILVEPEVPIEIIKDALLDCPIEYIEDELTYLCDLFGVLEYEMWEREAGWCGYTIQMVQTDIDQLKFLIEEANKFISFTQEDKQLNLSKGEQS